MHSALSEVAVRKAALYVGIAALVAGMAMAFEYGRAMSWIHAVSLGLLAIAVSIAFIAAEMYRAKGRKLAGVIATIAGVAFSFGEYGTHFGYTVGSRVADSQQTAVQNAKYDAVQKNRDSEVSNLAMWKDQLAKLTEANAWAATVKADAMRSELATLKGRIDDEKAGKRGRAAGCKAECERLQNAYIDLDKRIGVAEQAADLSKRIEATQRIIDRKVEVAGTTEFHSSKIVNQTAGFAQVATWTDKPSESAMSWTQLVLGAIIAAITTYLAPFCLSVAFSGLARMPDDMVRYPEATLPAQHITTAPRIIARHAPATREIVRERDPRWEALRAALA